MLNSESRMKILQRLVLDKKKEQAARKCPAQWLPTLLCHEERLLLCPLPTAGDRGNQAAPRRENGFLNAL